MAIFLPKGQYFQQIPGYFRENFEKCPIFLIETLVNFGQLFWANRGASSKSDNECMDLTIGIPDFTKQLCCCDGEL